VTPEQVLEIRRRLRRIFPDLVRYEAETIALNAGANGTSIPKERAADDNEWDGLLEQFPFEVALLVLKRLAAGYLDQPAFSKLRFVIRRELKDVERARRRHDSDQRKARERDERLAELDRERPESIEEVVKQLAPDLAAGVRRAHAIHETPLKKPRFFRQPSAKKLAETLRRFVVEDEERKQLELAQLRKERDK
jgi:hypothetical protein